MIYRIVSGSRVVHLLADFCSVFARLSDFDVNDAAILRQLGLDVTHIVQCLFARDCSVEVEQFGDFFSFMLNVDSCLSQRSVFPTF